MAKEITFDKFVRWAGIIILILGILYVTNYLSSVLLPFFIAWFFAYLLYPVVMFIENKMHVRIRALSIIIAMPSSRKAIAMSTRLPMKVRALRAVLPSTGLPLRYASLISESLTVFLPLFLFFSTDAPSLRSQDCSVSE